MTRAIKKLKKKFCQLIPKQNLTMDIGVKGSKSVTTHQARKIVSKEEMYNLSIVCPICLSNRERTEVMAIQTSPLVELLNCENCQGYSASWMPTPKTLDECYTNYYSDHDEAVAFHNIQRLADHIWKYLNFNSFDSEVRLLDFGGGNGSLAKRIADKCIQKNTNVVVEITLIDYLDYSQSKKSESDNIRFNFKRNLDELGETEIAAKYNLILASAVLEHIPELNAVMSKLFSLLKREGYFYARTPYIHPLLRLSQGIEFMYPYHVHDLGASFWNRIIQTFELDARIIVSQPSIVETEFKRAFFRTLAAYLFKFPAHLELIFTKEKKDILWNFIGGWEIILQTKNTPRSFQQ